MVWLVVGNSYVVLDFLIQCPSSPKCTNCSTKITLDGSLDMVIFSWYIYIYMFIWFFLQIWQIHISSGWFYLYIYIYIFSVSRKRCFTGRPPKNALQSVQQRVMRHYPRCRSHERRVLSDPATIWMWPGVVPTPEIWRIDTKHDGLEDVLMYFL